VPGQDLCVAKRDSGVEGVGDHGMQQRVRADVPRDAGDYGDARTMRYTSRRSICLPEVGRSTSGRPGFAARGRRPACAASGRSTC
jgi:hypothetical protein